MKQGIYETKGKAREFCELAINLYSGCGHGCVYCYSPDVIKRERTDFFLYPYPRLDRWTIERSINDWAAKGERRPILLCFVTDPYQPIAVEEEFNKLTRLTLELLCQYGLSFTVLTKAGLLAQRDFELYRAGDSFGATLTCLDEDTRRKWEPHAGPVQERLANLRVAHQRGISTWVSLEPVIDPEVSLKIIDETAAYVDHYKVGKLNYSKKLPLELRKLVEGIDWLTYAGQVVDKLARLGKGFYVKRDLGVYAGWPEGKKVGRQLP